MDTADSRRKATAPTTTTTSGNSAAAEYAAITLQVPKEIAQAYRALRQPQRARLSDQAAKVLSEGIQLESDFKRRSDSALKRLGLIQDAIEANCTEEQLADMRAYAETLS